MSDSYLVLYQGTRATVRVRKSNLENYLSEIDVIPNDEGDPAAFTEALKNRLKKLSGVYPNLSFRNNGRSMRVIIPDDLRIRGGSTFGQLVEQFLKYV